MKLISRCIRRKINKKKYNNFQNKILYNNQFNKIRMKFKKINLKTIEKKNNKNHFKKR